MEIAIRNLVVDTRSIAEHYHNLISVVVSLEFGAVRVCPRHAKTLPLSHTHMPQSSPLQELATGLRRMLSPPGPTQHHSPLSHTSSTSSLTLSSIDVSFQLSSEERNSRYTPMSLNNGTHHRMNAITYAHHSVLCGVRLRRRKWINIWV